MTARVAVIGLGRMGRVHAANLARRGWLATVVDSLEAVARGVEPHQGTHP